MAYPTTAQVKTYLPASGSGEDTLIDWLLGGAVKFVENYTGHDFVADAAETFYVVPEYPNLLNGRRTLLLRDREVITLTSVTNGDGVAVASGNYCLLPKSGPPYYKIELDPDSGLYWWRGSDGAGVVTVVASSEGYSAACPADVFMAILQLVAYLYRGRSTGAGGPVTTASRAGLIIPASEVPANILTVLDAYRRRPG